MNLSGVQTVLLKKNEEKSKLKAIQSLENSSFQPFDFFIQKNVSFVIV
jgi:hypothetical protein